MEILNSLGLLCEPLHEFASNLGIAADEEACPKILVCHLDTAKRSALLDGNASCWGKRSTSIEHHRQALPSRLPNDVKPAINLEKTLKKIIELFKYDYVVSYLLKDCYLLLQSSGINGGYEAVTECDLNKRLERRILKRKAESRHVKPIKRMRLSDVAESKAKNVHKGNSDESELKWPKKGAEAEHVSDNRNVYHCSDSVFLDVILYDIKQRNTVCDKGVDDILKEIIHKDEKVIMPDEWERAARDWLPLRRLLQYFVSQNTSLSENNGYARVLRKHLIYSEPVRGRLEPVPKKRVESYICDIIRRILPVEFFGSNRQRKQFLSVICELINGAKHQRFTLGVFLDCFATAPNWYQDLPPLFKNTIFMRVIKFFILKFLQVLKAMFYVTECGSTGFELFYYLKADMESAISRHIMHLQKTGKIEKTDSKQVKQENFAFKLATCKGRFMPKSPDAYTQLRLLTIMRKENGRQNVDEGSRASRARMLLLAKFLDCLLSSTSTGILPFSSSQQLHQAWQRVYRMKQSGKQLFFVKADITDAFGSVDLCLLVTKLDTLCPDSMRKWREIYIEEWAIQRGTLCKFTRTSFSRKISRNRILKSRAFVENNEGYTTADMKEVLRQVITQQTVLMGGKLFKLKMGLCQGGAGTLSTRLCDVYYSLLDRNSFPSLLNDPDCVVLRAVDDYLLVTSQLEKASQFLTTVTAGIPKFNAQFSKIVTNVKQETPMFPYLGLIFNINDLSVRPHYRMTTSTSLNFMKLSITNTKTHEIMDLRCSKDYVMKQRLGNLNSLKLLPIVLNELWSDTDQLIGLIIESCRLHACKAVQLANFLKPSSKVIIESLKKGCAKMIRLVPNLAPPVVCYIYWQSIYSEFKKFSRPYMMLNKELQRKIIHHHLQAKQWACPFQQHWWVPERTRKEK